MIIFYKQIIDRLQKKMEAKGLTKKELNVAFGLTAWYVHEESNEGVMIFETW